jgi:hypothetical protein
MAPYTVRLDILMAPQLFDFLFDMHQHVVITFISTY